VEKATQEKSTKKGREGGQKKETDNDRLEEEEEDGAEEDGPIELVEGTIRETTILHPSQYVHKTATGFAEVRASCEDYPTFLPAVVQEFQDRRVENCRRLVRPAATKSKAGRPAITQKNGADLFVIIMGTNTCLKDELGTPGWNVFCADDLPHIEYIARTVLDSNGVLALVHSGKLYDSQCIYESFFNRSVHWAPPETYTIWHETGRWIHRGSAMVKVTPLRLLSLGEALRVSS